MDQGEQEIIDGLFARLRQVEDGADARDAAAERRIAGHLERQPAAPYYMAQAIVVQEEALKAASARLERLEDELARRPTSGGGFLGSLFGAGPVPRRPRRDLGADVGPGSSLRPRPGGTGFLGGALQTAMGVAGGVLLGSMLAELVAPDAAAADEGPERQGAVDDGELGGFEDGTDDFGGMDDGF